MLGGGHICIAYVNQSSPDVKGSNSGKLLLEVGDVVYLNLWTQTSVSDGEGHHTTFSLPASYICNGNQPCIASVDLRGQNSNMWPCVF